MAKKAEKKDKKEEKVEKVEKVEKAKEVEEVEEVKEPRETKENIFAKIMQDAVTKAEKASKMKPVFLKRDSFAASATSTGSLWLDYKLGGGIPPSRIIGISGPERSGKTLLATQIAHNHLKTRLAATFFDAEGANDPIFLQARGIDFDKYRGQRDKGNKLKKGEIDLIQFYQPDTLEEVTNYMGNINSILPENRNPEKAPMLFLLDSAVALVSNDLNENIDANKMAMHARMYSQYLPIINNGLKRTGCSLVYTNQIRLKPGVVYGSNSYEPGGEALKFFSAIRIGLSNTKPKIDNKDHPFIETGDNSTILNVAPKQGGVWEEPHMDANGDFTGGVDKYVYTGIKTVKNKVYIPYQACWIRIQFEENGSTGYGLDPVFDIFSILYETGYINKVRRTSEEKAHINVAVFEAVATDDFDIVKEFKLPQRFNYYEFKLWVKSIPELVSKLRDRLLISGLLYK